MKKTRMLLTALFASAMALTMGGIAWAESTPADMAGQNGVIGEFNPADTAVVQDDSVIIYKEITAYNPETCRVNAPTITYNYAITAGDANKDIYDESSAHNPAANVHAKTKAGVGNPTITGTSAGTLAITPSDKLNASTAGEKNVFALTVDFSSIDFMTAGTGAGVYRYVITETCTDDTKNAAGIADGTISAVRYMDVYVDGSGDIYGYVCFQNNNNIDARSSATDTVTKAAKTEGFVATTNGGSDGETTQTADSYYTFNFDLTKVVNNDDYAKNTHHQFPFTVTLANSNVTAAVLPIMTVGTNATQSALSIAAIGGQTWSPTIADGATINYVGIPCGTTITIYETNDVTGVTYTSISTNADTNAASKNIDTGTVSNNAIINCTSHITAATENHTTSASKAVTFTNTLLQISPTGVVLRYGAFAAMLVAGIALMFVATRRQGRKQK